MNKKIKFTACEHLNFANNYSAKKVLINSFGTKVCWERKMVDVLFPRLVQYCKKSGRLNNPDSCLREADKMCSDYKKFEHTVII